jgi:hypothetical protein
MAKIIIEVRGGVVEEVYSDMDDVEVILVDHNEDSDTPEVSTLPLSTEAFEDAEEMVQVAARRSLVASNGG